MALLPKWGIAAVNKANEDARTRHSKQKLQAPDTEAPKTLSWRQPADLQVWASLYSAFNDLSRIRPPKWGEDAPQLDSARPIVTAYQGLLHSALIDAWV